MIVSSSYSRHHQQPTSTAAAAHRLSSGNQTAAFSDIAAPVLAVCKLWLAQSTGLLPGWLLVQGWLSAHGLTASCLQECAAAEAPAPLCPTKHCRDLLGS